MRASDFEYRHQVPLHLLLVGFALAAYWAQPDDVVWAAVRHHANSAFLERLVFGAGTVELLACAIVETWAGAHGRLRTPMLASRLLFALALGLLLPVAGTVLLLAGEALIVWRLCVRYRETAPLPAERSDPRWREGFELAASKWGLAASMIVFTWTLRDRIAEAGAAASVVVWFALNFRRLARLRED
jgi:hypothetical protein